MCFSSARRRLTHPSHSFIIHSSINCFRSGSVKLKRLRSVQTKGGRVNMIKSVPASKCRLTGQGKPIRNGPSGLKLCRGRWVYGRSSEWPTTSLTLTLDSHTHTHSSTHKSEKTCRLLSNRIKQEHLEVW